jgi:hypothetical protein
LSFLSKILFEDRLLLKKREEKKKKRKRRTSVQKKKKEIYICSLSPLCLSKFKMREVILK